MISVEKVENKLGQHYMKYMHASQQNMIKIVFIALSFMVSAILSWIFKHLKFEITLTIIITFIKFMIMAHGQTELKYFHPDAKKLLCTPTRKQDYRPEFYAMI